MRNYKLLLATLILSAIIIASCSKSDSGTTTCKNTDALNYGKQVGCIFPRDIIIGSYEIVVTQYPLQPLQVGDSFQMDVKRGTCVTPSGDSVYKFIEIDALTGTGFSPTSDWCIYLHGSNFTLTDTSGIGWAGAPVTGEGNFTNGVFTFHGIVHSSDGDSAITLMSSRFQSSN